MKPISELAQEFLADNVEGIQEDATLAFYENKVVVYMADTVRGVGKTTFLKAVSLEYDIPIVYPSRTSADMHNGGLTLADLVNHQGRKYILIDDLPESHIQYIKDLGFIPLGFAVKDSKEKSWTLV